MNPLVDFKTLQTTHAQSGTIVDKTANGVTVKLTTGSVVTFPNQPNLELGDAVALSNGRLSKSPTLKTTQVYVV